jgi:hypothetical protein
MRCPCREKGLDSQVKLTDAKREFTVRGCYWLRGELKNEIKSGFLNLRLFKSGYGWQLHRFMQKLKPSDQLTLANAMIKRNATYLEASGEVMTSEEKASWDSFEQFLRVYSGQSRRQAGEKIKFASKRTLRKAAVSKFVEAFGLQCFDMKLGEEWDPLFQMKCCGWIISTQLYFGRQQPVVNYRHMIVSETRIAHPDNSQITGPAMELTCGGFEWLQPFGNHWEDVMKEDIEGTCNALIKHAGFFLAVAPMLLKGLEFEKITADS